MSRRPALGVRGRNQLAMSLHIEQGHQRRAGSPRRLNGQLPGHSATRATANTRVESCSGGASESLEDAIVALFDGASEECLACEGEIVRRDDDGALVCGSCASTLQPASFGTHGVAQLDAA
jgi:hypothetical protein